MFWGFMSIRAAEGTLGRRNIHKLVKPSFCWTLNGQGHNTIM